MKVPSCNNLCGILLNCSPEQRAAGLLKWLPISWSHFFLFWWKGFLAHLIFHIFRPENSQWKKVYISLFVFNLYSRVSDTVNGLIKLWLTFVVLTCHIKCFYWIPSPMTGPAMTGNSSQQPAPFISLLRESELTTSHFFHWGNQTCIFFHDGNHQKDGAHMKQSCFKYISVTPLFF